MELNWTTFILEIVNFLVLVWLLKRLLYRPVKEMIQQRKLDLEEQLQKSRDMKSEAEQLVVQYKHRLADWEKERQDAKNQLNCEIEEQRERLLAKLEDELSTQKMKNTSLIEREKRMYQVRCELRGVELGARFAARLLTQVASEELESRLIDMVMAEMPRLPDEQHNMLTTMEDTGRQLTAEIISAYPLSEKRRQELQTYLNTVTARQLPVAFSQDPQLLAGLRITIGPWIIDANLAEELRGFAAAAQDSSNGQF